MRDARLLASLLLLVTSGCDLFQRGGSSGGGGGGGGDSAASPGEDYVVLAPEAVLPESLDGFEGVEISEDRLVFTFSGGASAAGLAAGDVLIGAQDGGYLRRATAASVDGDTATVDTEPAALTDALVEAEIAATISLVDDWSEAGRAAQGARRSNLTSIELADVTLFEHESDGASFEMTLEDGVASLTPSMDFDLVIRDRSVQGFSLEARADVALEAAWCAGPAAAPPGWSARRERPLPPPTAFLASF